MTISLLETVLITCILHHNSMKYREVPHWVQVLVMHFIARLICYSFPEDPLAKLEGKQETNPWVTQPSESTSSQQTSTNGETRIEPDVNFQIKGIQTCSWMAGVGCTAEFSTNPNLTHLNHLIKDFRFTRKNMARVLELVEAKLNRTLVLREQEWTPLFKLLNVCFFVP